jgi:hypothetical protein
MNKFFEGLRLRKEARRGAEILQQFGTGTTPNYKGKITNDVLAPGREYVAQTRQAQRTRRLKSINRAKADVRAKASALQNSYTSADPMERAQVDLRLNELADARRARRKATQAAWDKRAEFKNQKYTPNLYAKQERAARGGYGAEKYAWSTPLTLQQRQQLDAIDRKVGNWATGWIGERHAKQLNQQHMKSFSQSIAPKAPQHPLPNYAVPGAAGFAMPKTPQGSGVKIPFRPPAGTPGMRPGTGLKVNNFKRTLARVGKMTRLR